MSPLQKLRQKQQVNAKIGIRPKQLSHNELISKICVKLADEVEDDANRKKRAYESDSSYEKVSPKK